MDEHHGPADPPKMEQFAQLLATCQRRTFLYLLGLLHSAADAEEVLQETNLILWRKFDQFQPGTCFDRWACRIAYFEAMKFRERKAQSDHLFSTEFVESLAAEAEKTWDLLDARRDALAHCLEKLKEKDRELVLHRYQEQATTRGVAETLGRGMQGTRKALHRIRAALLACIERTLAREGQA